MLKDDYASSFNMLFFIYFACQNQHSMSVIKTLELDVKKHSNKTYIKSLKTAKLSHFYAIIIEVINRCERRRET